MCFFLSFFFQSPTITFFLPICIKLIDEAHVSACQASKTTLPAVENTSLCSLQKLGVAREHEQAL